MLSENCSPLSRCSDWRNVGAEDKIMRKKIKEIARQVYDNFLCFLVQLVCCEEGPSICLLQTSGWCSWNNLYLCLFLGQYFPQLTVHPFHFNHGPFQLNDAHGQSSAVDKRRLQSDIPLEPVSCTGIKCTVVHPLSQEPFVYYLRMNLKKIEE